MMKTKIWTKSLAGVCAAVTAVPVLAMSASAATYEPVAVTGCKVVALGDDCLAETGDGKSAVSIVADYLGGTAVNYAKVGATSGDLVTAVQSDAALRADVESAEVIMVSVGVNDLIAQVLYENTDLVDLSNCSTLIDVANKLTTDINKLDAANKKLAANLPGVVDTIFANIETVVTDLHKLNRTADIVVECVNNPLGVDYNNLGADYNNGLPSVSQNRRAIVSYLYTYLDAALAGGTVNNFELEPMTVEMGLNQRIRNLKNASAADFYGSYVGAVGEKAFGFELSNIMNLNMTFTPVGQVALAAAAIQSTEMLSRGNGSVVADAYTATGKSDAIKSNRASLDSMINAAAAHTMPAYYMGDADASGRVDTDDLFLCMYNIALVGAGYDTQLDPVQRKALDADVDGKLDSQDMFLWMYYMAQAGAGIDVNLEDYLAQNKAA